MENTKPCTYPVAHPAETTEHDFGVTDARGRKIGALVHRFMTEYVEREGGWAANCMGSTRPAGMYITLQTQASRDGVPYGAWQDARYFTTEAEREAAVAKYLKDAQARALKNAKKGA